MKLRIVLGKDNVSQYLNNSDIGVVYKNDECVIQADDSMRVFEVGPDQKFFMMGSIVGLLTDDQSLKPVSSDFSNVVNHINGTSLKRSLPDIEGRFIFIKVEKDGVYVGTDSQGKIDLYYEECNGGIILGSDLGLLPFKDSREIKYDQLGAAHALYIYGYRPAKRHTLYSNVKRLGSNEILEWKNGNFIFSKGQRALPETCDYGPEMNKQYVDLFLDAIEKRSSPNGNIVYLSSGWDSTSILASLVKLHGPKKVRAVIGRMHFSESAGICNPYEIARAKKIAEYYGVKLEIAEFDYYKRGPELTEKYADLMKGQMATSMAFYQWLELGNYVASNSNGEAVFSGEISDGAHNFGFSQMLTVLEHPAHEFREYSDKMATYLFGPTFLKSIWVDKFQTDTVYSFLKERCGDKKFDAPKKDEIGKTSQLLSSLFLRDNRFPFWSMENSNYFTKEGREYYSTEMQSTYIDEFAKNITEKNLYSSYIDLYGSFHWNGGTVATMLMTGDLFKININLPFRDSRILQFLSEMPESWGRGLEMRPTKYPLKWMLEHAIDYPIYLQVGPHSYLYDTDPTFDHAAEWNYRSAFYPQYKKILKKRWYQEVLSEEYFNVGYLDKIVTNYINGKEVLEEKHDLENLIYFSIMGFYGQT
tara:strand:- start:3815 stop:5746 length:1932 start_codon:yes stop_codon:yes gene_type:complete